uniref:Uncharacterized protein n=1 Tax=Meloidogyne enterolobii TaxID=390850 RepID=A0A6V7WYL1_MELEN|nr:unnamed protein product [Meloidogyne enterolobii]
MPKVIDGDVYCKEEDFVEIKSDENLEKSKKKGCKYITSKDITVAKLLEYFYLKIDKIEGLRGELEQVEFENNKCNIGFPLPKNIFGKAFLLDTALSFSGDELEELVHGEEKMVYDKLLKEEEENDDEEDNKEEENNDEEEEEGEGDVRLSTHVLLEAIYKGSNAFTKDSFLNLEKIPEMEYKYEIKKQKKFKNTSKRISQKIHKILKNMIESVEKKIGNDTGNQTSSQKEEPPKEEHDDFDKEMTELKKLKDGKLTIDKKLKLEIYEKKEEIEKKLIGILNGYKTVEEKKGQIGKWKKIVDDWEKDARKSFEKKIEIKKDKEGHKNLLEYKPRVFEFLKETTFGVSIKPSNKRFKNIEGEEYEELIEFFKNPQEFLNSPPEENETVNNDLSENSENKWKKKLSEKLLKFIFKEMEGIKGKRVGEEGMEVEEGEISTEYIIEVLNEEFKWLNLGFKRKVKEWFQKKEKVENNRKFGIEHFKILKKELTDIDNGIENCKIFKHSILQVLRYNDESDTIHQEFRGRMGAQILGSVYNAKELIKDFWNALLISLTGSGLISAVLDIGVWPSIILLISLTGCIPCAHAVGVILYMMTPRASETFDSLVIKRLLVSFDGGSFWPSSKAIFDENMSVAIAAGKIAAGGSIFNNLLAMEEISKSFPENAQWTSIFPAFPANLVATATSGPMVPLEFNEWRDHQRSALYKIYDQGFLPKPDRNEIVLERRISIKKRKNWRRFFSFFKTPETSPIITNKERDIAFREYIKSKIEASMDIQKTSAMAINSMGIGALISSLVLFALYFPSLFGVKIPEVLEKIFIIVVNTPTEIISFIAGTFSANKFGAELIEKWWSTDDMKNKQMVRLIIDRTIEQMKTPHEGIREIKQKEVNEIYHTKLNKLTYKYGKIVTKLMIVVYKAIIKSWNRMWGKPISESLFKKINIGKLALPFYKENEVKEDLTFNLSYLEDDLLKEIPKMPGYDEEKFSEFINEISPYHEKHKLSLTESHHYMAILDDGNNTGNFDFGKVENYQLVSKSVDEALNFVKF